MECKKCKRECLESELKNGICSECSTGNNSKHFYSRWWFWLAIAIVLVAIVCIYAISTNMSSSNNYKKQAVEILNEYSQGKITNTEAEEKIDSLCERVYKEYEENKETETLMLSSILQRIKGDFSHGEISYTEASKYIVEIKR